MLTKICSKCKKEQPIVEFYMTSGGRRDTRCRTCALAYQKAHHRPPETTPRQPPPPRTAATPEELQRRVDALSQEQQDLRRCERRTQEQQTRLSALHGELETAWCDLRDAIAAGKRARARATGVHPDDDLLDVRRVQVKPESYFAEEVSRDE